MSLLFVVQAWSVWPPSDTSSEQERAAQQQALLSSVPVNLKRRLSPLAKTVFCAISQCGAGHGSVPVVFSSTHGELAKSLEMIKLIEAGEDVSPTTFSLSVHNAIAGLFSIVWGNTAEITVLASGEDGIASAFIESLGLLQEGAGEVLLVFYDEPLPDFYPAEPFQLSTDSRCAVALTIAKDGAGQAMQLQRGEQCGYIGEQPIQLPLLRQFLSGAHRQLHINTLKNSWHWQKLDHHVGMSNSET